MAEETTLLRKAEVQRLLRALKDGKVKVIEPKLSYEHGATYDALSEITGITGEKLNSILEKLSMLELLETHIWGNLTVCPTCRSHRLMMHLRCPTCKSTSMRKGVVVEHMSCGHIDVEENFRKKDRLVCPKCGKNLKAIGVDYRKPGTLYKCLRCGGFYPTPEKHYTCDNGHSFEEQNLAIKEVKAYRLNPAKHALVERELIDFESILEEMRKAGWPVEAPAKIKGESGVHHEFVFAVWMDDEALKGESPDLVADLYTEEKEIDSIAPLAFQAKAMDVHSKEKVLIAMPGLDERAKLLAKSFGITVVESSKAKEIEEKTVEIITNMRQKQRKGTI